MPLRVNCPSCNAAFSLAEAMQGKKVRCKKCQGVFTVPPDEEGEGGRQAGRVATGTVPSSKSRDEDEDDKPRKPARGRRGEEDEDERPRRARGRDEEEDEEEEEKPRGKKKVGSALPIILCVAGALVLLLGAGGLWWALRGKSAPDNGGKDQTGDSAEASRQNMHKLQMAMITHSTTNGGAWPDRLEQIAEKVGGQDGLATLLKNPLTGDNPGYEYVKPQGDSNRPDFGSQVVLFQLRGGKRDTALKVGYADGSVRPYEAPAGPKGGPSAWTEFSHKEGRFTVVMPGTPQQLVQDTPVPAGKLKLTANVLELGDQGKAFAVVYADYPTQGNYGDEAFAQKVLDGVIGGVARSRKATVLKKSQIKIGAHHGQECLLDVGGGRCLCRAYLVKNRLFQLLSDWREGQGATSADAEKFMNSFRVHE